MQFLFSHVIAAADHAGVTLKRQLLEKLSLYPELQWADEGVFEAAPSVDYPDQVPKVAAAVSQKTVAGLLICGSGVGMSIAANRYPHVRAVLCQDPLRAQLARQHNDANVIVFGERLIGVDMAFASLITFLTTPFEGGRHTSRIEKLSRLGNLPVF
ncbi:MAG: RpiB/LacA/LacB family sugar-phosphate isomerase [Alphaproteobacteria bacterium]